MGNSGIDFDIDFYFGVFGISIHPLIIVGLLISTLIIFIVAFKIINESKSSKDNTDQIKFLKNTISDLNSITTKLNSEILELNSIIDAKAKEIEGLNSIIYSRDKEIDELKVQSQLK